MSIVETFYRRGYKKKIPLCVFDPVKKIEIGF